MSDPSTTEGAPDLRALLAVASDAHKEGDHRGIPASIMTYDPATQLANVKPLVMIPGRAGKLEMVTPVTGILVQWNSSAAGSFTFPLTAGDPGWIRPGGADISAWKMRAIENNILAVPRRGSLSDAVWVPGTRPVSNPLTADQWHATAAVLFALTELRLGGSTATDFVALAAKVVTELQYIRDYFDLHTHPTPAGPSSAPTTLFTAGNPVGNIAASKVTAI